MRLSGKIFIGVMVLLLASTGWAETSETDASADASATNSATANEENVRRKLAEVWGAKREVSVVQRRLYTKDGRYEITAFSGIIPNDDFVVYFPSGLRAGYHLSESFTVELSGAFAPESRSDLASFLENDLNLRKALVQETIKQAYTTNVLWAPFYGKISVLGTKLSHFETYLGVGFGLFLTDVVSTENPDGQGETKPAGNTVFGFRWFISDRFNVRTEYRQHFFQKEGGGVSIPVELSFGLGVTI